MNLKKNIEGDNIKFSISGKFTFADYQSFRTVLDSIKNGEGRVLIIDFSGVDFLDSAALGMLLVAKEEADKKRIEVILENASGHVQKMFELSDFNSMFNIR